MYFVLGWTTDPTADPATVRTDIVQAVNQIPFENGREPQAGCYIGNVKQGRGSGDVFDLQNALRLIAPGQFSFTLVYVRRGHLILHSSDLDGAALTRVVDY